MDYMEMAKMSLFMDFHKSKPKKLTCPEEAKNARMTRKAQERKSRRLDDFAINRRSQDEDDEPVQSAEPAAKPDFRRQQLLKWKEERTMKKKMEPKKPPPFKVGVVKHPLAPFTEKTFEHSCRQRKSPQVVRRVTRATTRLAAEKVGRTPVKSFAAPDAKFHAPKVMITKTKYTPRKVTKNKIFTGFPDQTTNRVGEISSSRRNMLSKPAEKKVMKSPAKCKPLKNNLQTKKGNAKKQPVVDSGKETDSADETADSECKTEVSSKVTRNRRISKRKSITKELPESTSSESKDSSVEISPKKRTPKKKSLTKEAMDITIGEASPKRRISKRKSITNAIKEINPEEMTRTDVQFSHSALKRRNFRNKSAAFETMEENEGRRKSKRKSMTELPAENILKTPSPKKLRSRRKVEVESENCFVTPIKEPKKRRSSKKNISSISDSEISHIKSTSDDEGVKSSSMNEKLLMMSPLVTVSRGKGNFKREYEKRRSYGCEETSSPQKTAQYFRNQLDAEVARLQDMCETWKSYKIEHEGEIPEEGKDLIHLAIGQTQLLISKKLEQFRSLISQCEKKEICEGEGIIKFQDLQGFWDMVYMQVENCDLRFLNLQEMKNRNWKEEFPVADKPKKKIVTKVQKPAKNFKASSSIKDAIRAARMQSKINKKSEENLLDTKIFEGGFFSVTSPVRNNEIEDLKRTPARRSSLLISVVSSEAKKKIVCTPHNTKAILKSSNVGKIAFNLNDTFSDDEKLTLPPVDLNKTPAKSILKTPGSAVRSNRKSVKIFTRSDDRPRSTRSSLISKFEDLQLEKNGDLVSQEGKENIDMSIENTRKNKRNPSINLISFDSPVRPQTRSRTTRNSVM